MSLNESLQEFIWQNRQSDPHQIALSAKKHPGIPVAEAAAQIQALQKIREKIPSWYRSGIEFPPSLSIEQASSEAAAQFKSGLFSGKIVADLTGGLGIDASYFARRFNALIYVEQNPELCRLARQNFGLLGIQNVHFENRDAIDFLHHSPEHFDLIYLDPARRDDRKGKVFQLEDCTPNILNIKDLLLEKSSEVLLKTAPLLDLHLAVTQLGSVAGIWIVATGGECREVLYWLKKDAPPVEQIPIQAVAIQGDNMQTYTFNWAEEKVAQVDVSRPQQYLYEPNAAVMKAGAFRSFGARFGLSKLHPNTHLYTSNEIKANVPARIFRIEEVCKYDKKAVRVVVPEGKAHIACRNFPDPTETVRKKLGLADGGDVYLFATSGPDLERFILVCRKIT